MKKHSYRRFVALFFVTFSIPTFFIAFINWMIDPLGYYQSATIKSINEVKVSFEKQQRFNRAIEIARQKPKVIFLGSSRVMAGLDPDDFYQLTGKTAYNAAFAGASIEEIYHYFEHALYHQCNLKTIVLGIDLFAFGKNKRLQKDFSLSRLQKGTFDYKNYLSLLFSNSSLKSSYETWKENAFGKPLPFFQAHGLYNPSLTPPKSNDRILKEDLEFITIMFKNTDFYSHYCLDPDKINWFQKLVQRCQEKGIELKVFVSPTHAIYWESLYRKNLWPVLEDLKRQLSAIHPVWDFSGFNCVTTQTIEQEGNPFYYGCSHYRPIIGKMILEKIFNHTTEPEGFGYLLTPNTINAVLKSLQDERIQWLNNNPHFLEALQTVLSTIIHK